MDRKTEVEVVFDHYFGNSDNIDIEGHTEELINLFIEALPTCIGGHDGKFCGKIPTWQSFDEMWCQYVCDQHKEIREPWNSHKGWVACPLGQRANALLNEITTKELPTVFGNRNGHH